MRSRALWFSAALAVLFGVVLVVILNADDDDESAPPDEFVPGPLVAPLTGLSVSEDERQLIERPALAVKVDNHPDAVPQWGIERADVVVELRVEGYSRLLAVFHSEEVEEIGPVRSARTSDPDLLAMFGRPLTAWSGANPSTRDLMRSIDWIDDVSVDRLPAAYRRESSLRAPHDLILDAGAAFDAAEEPVIPPSPIFEYLGPEDAPMGEPVPGMAVEVGSSRSEYVWDSARSGWARWSDGRPLVPPTAGGDDAGQVAPTNVVVLETRYEPSAADARSPEAVAMGEGRAWVFTDGHRVEGRWERADRESPWRLTADGATVRLAAGSTWVLLPSEGEPSTLTAERADALRG